MTAPERPVVLVVAQHYLPSEKAGGGVRTIVNMIERLSDRYRFRVVTTDRDLGATEPYRSVAIDRWTRYEPADVFYGSPGGLGLARLAGLVRGSGARAVYLNSFFSPIVVKYLLLRRFGRVGRVPAILAPEGELAVPALRQKRLKKRVYRWAASALGLYRDVHWKAAAPHEADAVRARFPRAREIRVAPNMPPAPEAILRSVSNPAIEKRPGELRLVFLSRIAPIKNLAWALDAVRGLDGRVTFDVFGPQERSDYWASCQRMIEDMPSHISVTDRGVVAADRVSETLSRYHFMILPTLGESFGHAILEALAAGCPPIISDRTPWLGLADEGVGWDLPLGDIEPWRDVLARCLAMDDVAYRAVSGRAVRYASDWLRAPGVEQATADYLRDVVAVDPG